MRSMKPKLPARLTAEFLGTAFLVATVIGSGIMAERLSGGNVAIELLANTIATGAALATLILTFGPISGAHLNPAVTLSDAIERGILWREALGSGDVAGYSVGRGGWSSARASPDDGEKSERGYELAQDLRRALPGVHRK